MGAPQRKRPEMKPQPPRDYSRYNNKNTSPTKSSPLASSPPTNASDMSSSSNEDRLSAASKKRKANDDSVAPAAKRQYRDQLNAPSDSRASISDMRLFIARLP